MTAGEYRVYCYQSPSGKRYIGQTKTSLAQRAGPNGENYEGCAIFWNAIQKYGWDSMTPTVLADNLSKEEADELEIKYIKEFKTLDIRYGYNMKTGGHHAPPAGGGYWAGKTLTEQHKLAISRAGRGRKHTKEAKEKMRKNSGHPQTEETRRKLSEMNKGVYHPPANPELARKRKNEAVKKVWERRRKENAGCSR